eukprot:TRINITY_DN1887_c0_g1_i2.p1 TRINITY_DN1887_c0_g1~~TRINITY_DN1887_c0_g1_i2.p1  ORF type:complete len:179 (+),score=36.30 TRINITY_DN1887_c0_g1_i2:433-969(+)
MPSTQPAVNGEDYSQFQDPDGNVFFLKWTTQTSSYDRPPPGSIIHLIDGNISIEQPKPPQKQPKLNDLDGVKKIGPPGANLFIFHLPNDYKDSDLVTLFQEYGTVISARIMTKPDGKSKGFGFVSYDDPKSAESAIRQLNGYQIGNKKLKVDLKKEYGINEMPIKPAQSLNKAKFNPF